MNVQNLQIIVCERKEIKDFIEKHHYSKSINGCKVSICFKVINDSKLVGAVLFGQLSTTSWKKYATHESDVLELRRLVLLDECPKNSESYVISRCIKLIKNIMNIKCLISYADPYHNHSGVIYQATNWIYLGQTSQDKILKTKYGKLYHSRAMRTKYNGKLKPFAQRLKDMYDAGDVEEISVPGKHIYVYPMNKKSRKEFMLQLKKYPKNTNIFGN